MESESLVFERDLAGDAPDPDAVPIKDRRVVTHPYDLAVDNIVSQINHNILFLRPLSDRPRFQRQYVWSDKLASRLIESVLLNVPIPPCYLAENENCEFDVIDGQQRIYSLYRYVENQFSLKDLEILTEHNGLRFFELPSKEQRKIRTHTMRCTVIKNESHPEIKFDVFERLNTSTMPLNAQELRNCMYRGDLNNLIGELSGGDDWLLIRGRKSPDKRLADEEIILRFFAFQLLGRSSYKTPLKVWLNDAARIGRRLDAEKIEQLRKKWLQVIEICLVWFEPSECFRRPGSKPINRALYDLVMSTAVQIDFELAREKKNEFLHLYREILKDDNFVDLISRSVDHKKRMEQRFSKWNEMIGPIFN